MVDKIDLSLDDIINQNKSIKNWRGRGRRGTAAGGNRRGRGSPRGGRNQPAKRSLDRPGSGGRGVLRNRRGITTTTARGTQQRSPYSRGDVNNKWKHDLYDGGRFNNRNRISTAAVTSALQPGKLLISNLDFGVSNADIEELFAEYGALKSAKVHYDKSGRSLGTADIVFERRADAVKAMKQYNGVPLDGRPMAIQLATSDLSLVSPVKRPTLSSRPVRGGSIQRGRGNIRRGSTGGFRRGGRGGGGAGGGGGGRIKKEPLATAEQLDAELDAYVNKME